MATSCLAIFALDVVAIEIGPAEQRPLSLWFSAAATLLIAGFWLGGGVLIDWVSRHMDRPAARSHFLARSGRVYAILIAYAVLTVASAATTRWLGSSADTIGVVLTTLALLVITAFIVATTLEVQRVYDFPALNALAVTFFPYAVISGLLIGAVLVISLLHAIGAV